MTDKTQSSPERETGKNQSEWISLRGKAENNEDLGAEGFPVVENTCSPTSSAVSKYYDCDNLDFGNADKGFI